MADRPAPLMVIPLPAPAILMSRALEIAAAVWAEHGQTLTTGHLRNEETDYGPVIVIPAPEVDDSGLVTVPAADLRHAVEAFTEAADTCGNPTCASPICRALAALNAALNEEEPVCGICRDSGIECGCDDPGHSHICRGCGGPAGGDRD